MTFSRKKTALVSGASIAGLSTAYWLNRLGYAVTIVEQASGLRLGGAAINVKGEALEATKRMGIFASLYANRLTLERWEYKNADDDTAGALDLSDPAPDDEIEIERDKFLTILAGALPTDVRFRFGDRITGLTETPDAIEVRFGQGAPETFDLVVGCDGLHSGVRANWFGPEADYIRFLNHYFSLTIVNKLLIPPNTAQLYNTPGKVIMLNAYNGKTDIVFCFFSETERPYDYRNPAQQSSLVAEQFAGQGWRTAELLDEVDKAKTAYFDKFAQIHMPSWTKGRVALVGDAAYCASPAAGSGGSLAILGAATLADALETHDGNLEAAFRAYNQTLRPHIEEVQATALVMLNEYLIPATDEAIQQRNAQGIPF